MIFNNFNLKFLLRLLLRSLRRAPVELPDDIIYTILLKLPKKTLLRFRTLSKEWNDRITSRSFSMDYKLTGPDPKVCNIFYFFPERFKDISGFPRFRIWGNWFQHQRALRYPCRQECCEGEYNQPAYMSCDGLFCIVCTRGDHPCPVTIWNPYTRQRAQVPAPDQWPSHLKLKRQGLFTFVGFGFDPAAGDYKIVIINSTQSPTVYTSRIIVTGLKSKAWRVVGAASVPSNLCQFKLGSKSVSSADGHVWWVCQRFADLSLVLLNFSLTEEKLSTCSLPPELSHRRSSGIKNVWLHHHDESIYLFYKDFSSDVKVWKLIRHGGTISWEIADLTGAKYPSNGDFLIRQGADLFVSIRSGNKFMKLHVAGKFLPEAFFSCRIHLLEMETLISP